MLGTLIKQINHTVTGADMAWQAQVGPGFNLLHPTGVVVGKHVKIGKNCMVQDGVTLGGRGGTEDGHPTVGDNVQIGCGAKLLGPVVIGDSAKIGANAVVLNDVPDGATAVGIPARYKIATT
jgi:serine O-acetyltransferase